MNRGMIVGAGLLLASAATAQQPARSVQQDFEAATALDAGTDHAAALAAWEALEKRTKPGTRSNAIVLVRKSNALMLVGRRDDAVAAARAGLEKLPATDATLMGDRYDAYFTIGGVAMSALDYAGAAAAFAQAEATAPAPTQKLSAQLWLVETQIFTDPAAASTTLGRLYAQAATMKLDKSVTAMIQRRHTRLLLNQGDFAGARASAVKAVTLLGGLTTSTNLQDVSARSDAAIALLLYKNPDEARRYMAMTGAGRLSKGEFDPASEMRAPDCGGDAGLKPDDVAVVEFSIDPDGSVSRAAPVYATGKGQVGLAFARAVRGWSWQPDKVASIPPFYRYNARVEMRCSTAFERPSIGSSLDAALEQWLAGKGAAVPPPPEGTQAAALPQQRAALTAAEKASPSSLATLAAVYRLMNNGIVSREETAELARRGLTIATAQSAPPLARLTFDVAARSGSMTDWWKPAVVQRLLTPLLSDPAYAVDPQARSAIRLLIADGIDNGKGGEAVIATLRPVATDKALAANDPLRVGALIRIASIEQRTGQVQAARNTFADTGLSASQCAIMDAPPKMVSDIGSRAFPMEAMRWGFEGWTVTQFDVSADGRSEHTRALLSYPPFIFSEAGSKFFDTAKFAKTYRPDGGLGCGGTVRRVVFRLPG
ncbi:energy transducer TonB [Sphingomonas sp. Leaf339]|uniref:energy transducer TonB n=1 Tax=Sphingomonas sp. Leaf339 TaxID=1736343 RepID=UPI0012E38A7A|nr:hypothetical protein [Sphingomonas sp. Leaf339]